MDNTIDSLEFFLEDLYLDELEKGLKAQIGEIRTWNGRQWQKIANGKWKTVAKTGKVEHYTHGKSTQHEKGHDDKTLQSKLQHQFMSHLATSHPELHKELVEGGHKLEVSQRKAGMNENTNGHYTFKLTPTKDGDHKTYQFTANTNEAGHLQVNNQEKHTDNGVFRKKRDKNGTTDVKKYMQEESNHMQASDVSSRKLNGHGIKNTKDLATAFGKLKQSHEHYNERFQKKPLSQDDPDYEELSSKHDMYGESNRQEAVFNKIAKEDAEKEKTKAKEESGSAKSQSITPSSGSQSTQKVAAPAVTDPKFQEFHSNLLTHLKSVSPSFFNELNRGQHGLKIVKDKYEGNTKLYLVPTKWNRDNKSYIITISDGDKDRDIKITSVSKENSNNIGFNGTAASNRIQEENHKINSVKDIANVLGKYIQHGKAAHSNYKEWEKTGPNYKENKKPIMQVSNSSDGVGSLKRGRGWDSDD